MGQARVSNLPGRVERMITPAIESMGFEVVRVTLSGGGRAVLQVMAERAGGGSMTVDDCARISRTVSTILDVEDPIPGRYALEVSSPGIDRPLVKPRDFIRYEGCEARIETRQPVEGRRRFKGRLAGCAGGIVRIATEEGTAALPLADIHRAKLVLTDELVRGHQRKA
jgi:ribosome maturation factor RimP